MSASGQSGAGKIIGCTSKMCSVICSLAIIVLVDASIQPYYLPHHEAFSKVMELLEQHHASVAEVCHVKIILPRTQPETFHQQRNWILEQIKSMTNIDIKNVEVIHGSCHVILTLLASAFIRFVCCLLSPESLWQLLSSVDRLVEIQLGNLPPVKLSRIFKKFAHSRAVSRDLDYLAMVKRSWKSTHSRLCESWYVFVSAENKNSM